MLTKVSSRHRGLKALVGRFVDDFEHNPAFQVRFHFVMMWFWMVNAVAGVTVLVLFPHLWVAIGVFYVFMLSIYANWDTDYDAVSAASAFLHAKKAAEEVSTPPEGGSGDSGGVE